MTDIEQKALALVNEVADRDELWVIDDVKGGVVYKALCRAIEQHEAFKLEVSEIVDQYVNGGPSNAAGEWERLKGLIDEWERLKGLIIAKPDPLVEVINDADDMVRKPDAPSYAEAIRAALAARGLEVRKIGEGE